MIPFRICSVQFSHSVMSNSVTPWTAARQASPSITNSQSLLKFMSIESVMPSNHLILCRPLPLLHSIFPNIRVFSNESVLHNRWPKYSSISINPFKEYSGLIPFRTDCSDILAVQGALKSLLQHHSSKASILLCSAFFMVQLSHPYTTTGKTVSQSVSSVAQSCQILCDPMNHSTPGLPVHHQHPESTQTHVHRVGDAIQPSHPLSAPPPAPSPSQHQSLFQHHSSKASILLCSAFFIVQVSHPYMTGKTIALTRCIFVGKVMSLLFIMLSRLVIAFFQGASVF